MAVALKSKSLGEFVIEPITADPEFAAANDLLSALIAQRRDAERKVQIADLLLWANHGSRSDRENIQRQLQALRAEQGEIPPRRTVAPAIDRAIDLIFGKRAPEPTPEDDVRQARKDIELLNEAVRSQTAVVAEIRDRKSFEVAKALVAEHRSRTLALYRAAQQLVRARDAKDALHRQLIAAGYIDRTDILPNLAPGSAYALGAEAIWDSQISTLRRALEDRGIL